ncbi:MAG: toxin of toxin-antitoxin system [Alphaproteobacteria bacterium]|nr:toxin of toxin-antitoxin system [Alphaproteobacteria bacterium]
MNLVIDCSFIMTSILPDELQLKVDEVYNQISNNVFNVYVPINNSDYEEYLQILNQLPVTVDKFCSTSESLYSIGRIATAYNLTSYDSAYLELALRLEAKIATLDKELRSSCEIANIESII